MTDTPKWERLDEAPKPTRYESHPPPTLLRPMAPSERNLAHLEDCLDHVAMTAAAASLLWLRIAAMAAALDYGVKP